MPAEIVTSRFCADYDAEFVFQGTAPGTEWHVTTDGLFMSCTCPAYEHAPDDAKECKHMRAAWQKGCFWNPQWYDGGTREIRPRRVTTRTVPNETCPRCGGPVIPVRIAV